MTSALLPYPDSFQNFMFLFPFHKDVPVAGGLPRMLSGFRSASVSPTRRGWTSPGRHPHLQQHTSTSYSYQQQQQQMMGGTPAKQVTNCI